MEFLFEYGLFLAKAITFVVTVIAVLIAVIALTSKQKEEIILRIKEKGEKVTDLCDVATIFRTVFNKEKTKLCPTTKETIIL